MSTQQDLINGLQAAYVKAGEDMGLQMAGAVAAVVSEAAMGSGLPLCMAWPAPAAPQALKDVVPFSENSKWVIVISEGLEQMPFLEGAVEWKGELVSGHRVILLT